MYRASPSAISIALAKAEPYSVASFCLRLWSRSIGARPPPVACSASRSSVHQPPRGLRPSMPVLAGMRPSPAGPMSPIRRNAALRTVLNGPYQSRMSRR